MKYICDVCGYEYDEALGDPDHGIAPGTKWEDRLFQPCASRPFYCRSSEGSLISQSSRGTIFFRPSTVTST